MLSLRWTFNLHRLQGMNTFREHTRGTPSADRSRLRVVLLDVLGMADYSDGFGGIVDIATQLDERGPLSAHDRSEEAMHSVIDADAAVLIDLDLDGVG